MPDVEDAPAPTCAKVCAGEVGPLVGCLTCPFVLSWHACSLYLVPCLGVLASRAYRAACEPCQRCCRCYVYTDREWSGQKALGEGKHAKTDRNVSWVRAPDLVSGQLKLFEGKIEPADLCQGAVGDCWLIAALACCAEHPATIRNAFLTPEFNPRGKYRVRLYDAKRGAFVVVTIDDLIPCAKGTTSPLFVKMNGNELWAVLLEKAFAKLWGSYAALDGGLMSAALHALTGDHTFRLDRSGATWKRRVSRHVAETYTPDETWVLIQKYIAAGSLLAAAAASIDGRGAGAGLNNEVVDEKTGLVAGHAYSILDARELGLIGGLGLGAGVLGKTKLVRLRNPWGRFEWKGAWSDGAREWTDHPLVRMRLRPEDADDGSFWMPWDAFLGTFGRLDVCDRTTTRDLQLRVNEDDGPSGVVLGCLAGCAEFFCTCRGLRTIYFGHVSTCATKSAERGWLGLV